MRPLLTCLAMILAGTILIILSYVFVDRQVVWWLVAHHSRSVPFFKIAANDITLLLNVLIVLFYLYYGINVLLRRLTYWDRKTVLLCHAVVIGQFLKEALKVVFGRYWPATFASNPSLIDNHVYGFNWFKMGTAYASFPSGHTTFIFSFAAVLWCVFPKLRWLACLLCVLVISGQIVMYYHFVSDIIAGVILGTLVGVCVVRNYLENQKI